MGNGCNQPTLGLTWELSMLTTPFSFPNPRPHHGGAEVRVGFLHQFSKDWETLKEREKNIIHHGDVLGPALVSDVIPKHESPAREK